MMATATPDLRREALIAAFKPFRGCLSDDRINREVATLVLLGQPAPTLTNEFRRASSEAAKKELTKILHASKTLANLIESLHSTSIDALANLPAFPGSPPYRICAGTVRQCLPAELRILAKAADEARKLIPDDASGERGAKGNKRAKIVGDMLAKLYFEATGKPPTHTKGQDFYILVDGVFRALEIDAKPAGVAKSASQKWREKKASTN